MHEFEDLSDALFGCPLSGVAIFDTETTGFSDGDEILEIAVVDGYGETLLSSYVRPQHHTKWPGEPHHVCRCQRRSHDRGAGTLLGRDAWVSWPRLWLQRQL